MSFRGRSTSIAFGLILCCLVWLSPAALAQDDFTSTTVADDDYSSTTVLPVEYCSKSLSMNPNLTEFAGTWWEVARYPATPDTLCVEVDFSVQANNTVDIATTYSNTPTYPWVNQTMTTSIVVNTTDDAYDAGYNISYINGLTNTTYTVFKLLETDYNNYALICGYTNATDESTAFALVLTRLRVPNTKTLDGYIEGASKLYANFLNNSMATVNQEATCMGSTAHALQFSYGALIITLMLMLMSQFGS